MEKSYIVEITLFADDGIEFLNFVSECPIGSEGFMNDAYDCVFSHGYDIHDFMILGFEEGF